MHTRPSREVRLADGVTEGYLEDLLFRAHSGTTGDLVGLIGNAELEVQLERSKAAEEVGHVLLLKLQLEGYITASDIHHELVTWHENEVLGLGHEPNGS